MQPIYTCLWFEANAQTAAEFYCSVFENSKIVSANPLVVIFELNGKKFMGLNGGSDFQFNPAISFVIECETQNEIDHYWNTLSQGGKEGKCGWLTDKYGISWQVVPTILGTLMSDPERVQSVTNAFLKMKKFDIQKLLDA